MAAGSSFAILTQVSYPTQLIGKCAKPILAAIGFFIVHRRFYTIQRYLCLVAIIIGVVFFMIRSDCTVLGIIMIGIYLALNAAIFGIQEYVRKSGKVPLIDVVFNVHAFSTFILSFIFIALFDILPFIYYITQYPIVLCLITLLGVSYACGQVCMCYMSETFGDKSYAPVLVIRKLCSLFFSVFAFGNVLFDMQWIGVAVLFVALSADVVFDGLDFDIMHAHHMSRPE